MSRLRDSTLSATTGCFIGFSYSLSTFGAFAFSTLEFQTLKPFNRFALFKPFLSSPAIAGGGKRWGFERLELFEHLNVALSIPTLRSPACWHRKVCFRFGSCL